MERGSFPEGREGIEGPAADAQDRPVWEKDSLALSQAAGNMCPHHSL